MIDYLKSNKYKAGSIYLEVTWLPTFDGEGLLQLSLTFTLALPSDPFYHSICYPSSLDAIGTTQLSGSIIFIA